MNFKKLLAFLLCIFILNSCTGFQPIYKNNIEQLYALQNFVIITDNTLISRKIKKELITLFPPQKKSLYILKIEASMQSLGTVSDVNRRISRYKVETLAKIKIYKRKKLIDKLIYEFDDKQVAPYDLISNNVRSTLASRQKNESLTVQLISASIYKRILMFMSKSK